MSAVIDGDPFDASNVSFRRSEGSVRIEGDNKWRWGSDPDEPFRGIDFDFPDQGTGTVTASRAVVRIGPDSSLANELVGVTSVSVSVSTAKRMTGTFSFTLIGGLDTVRITKGRFDFRF